MSRSITESKSPILRIDRLIMDNCSMVEEVPGFYGSVKIEEIVLQRIWAGQDFFTNSLTTTCGKHVVILSSGEWNRSTEGPDFINAKLLINGETKTGDIEINLQTADWEKHRHGGDENFNKVILQVCIFADSNKKPAFSNVYTQNGKIIPSLILLPHLFYGLEEYAESQVMAELSGKDKLIESKLEKLNSLQNNEMEEFILSRWLGKTRFAKTRLSKQGWRGITHQWFLEVLGYQRNRSPMVRISYQFPWEAWRDGEIDPFLVFNSQNDWRLSGCRPANHPFERIKQYSELWERNPGWMDDFYQISDLIKETSTDLGKDRKKLSKLVNYWRQTVLGGVFASGKANTLWVDCALPVLSASHQIDAFDLWKKWPAGDSPKNFREWAKLIGWTDPHRKKYFTNGLVQCIIGVFSS